MQGELKRIQREVGITFVYVTHDQEEALTMSDRLAVFSHGRIEQVGAPVEVYEEPSTTFVASFLGTSNLIQGRLAQRLVGAEQPHTLRPERIRLLTADMQPGPGELVVEGQIRDAVFLGSLSRYRVDVGADADVQVVVQNTGGAPDPGLVAPGGRVRLSISPMALRPVATGESLKPEPEREENQP
jgi:putative spermidine/putrescine transport system ATP-binding protein